MMLFSNKKFLDALKLVFLFVNPELLIIDSGHGQHCKHVVSFHTEDIKYDAEMHEYCPSYSLSESSKQHMDIARFPPFVLSGTVHNYSQSSLLLCMGIHST